MTMIAGKKATFMSTASAGSAGSYLKARKTTCINGHLFTKASSYISPKGYRACRTCKRNNVRKYRAEKS